MSRITIRRPTFEYGDSFHVQARVEHRSGGWDRGASGGDGGGGAESEVGGSRHEPADGAGDHAGCTQPGGAVGRDRAVRWEGPVAVDEGRGGLGGLEGGERVRGGERDRIDPYERKVRGHPASPGGGGAGRGGGGQ